MSGLTRRCVLWPPLGRAGNSTGPDSARRPLGAIDRRTFLVAGAGMLCSPLPAAAQGPPHVVFLNPGEPVERGRGPQWRMAARFMAAAARVFRMNLEVLYAERDHLLMLHQAEEVAHRAQVPDYVIIVNEKLAAQQMLRTFEHSPAKVLLIHNDLTPEQRQDIGNERERIRNWIGTVTTDDASGSYRLMDDLFRQSGSREARIIGITGDRNTPVSLARAEGVNNYVAKTGRGRILQLAFSDWSSADARRKADVLLARYPETNIIWAANDSMALGALSAVKARGAPVLVGGTGGWEDALASVAEGGMAATVATHFFIGAWAIVMLYDFDRGHDFAAYGGPNQKLDYMYVVNRSNVDQYRAAVFEYGELLDYSLYSKTIHPKPGPYEFSIERMVRRLAGP